MSASSSRRKVWAIPSLLAILILAGLMSALLGERMAWKALAWVLLAVPVGVSLWFACLKQRA